MTPNGFRYYPGFITIDDETSLVDEIARVEFTSFEMRGTLARRRVAFFGRSYERGGHAPPLPDFLEPLRDRVAAWGGVEPGAFVMALINEYPPGAPIGWHRDAPQYDVVAGISLLSSCRMKFRPYVAGGAASASMRHGRRAATHQTVLERRSAYLMEGEARSAYEHHIPAVAALRYSITFRTLRVRASPRSRLSPGPARAVPETVLRRVISSGAGRALGAGRASARFDRADRRIPIGGG